MTTRFVTRTSRAFSGAAGVLFACASAASCSKSESKATAALSLSREDLLDPATCAGCHDEQFREWSGSMHAYAGDDPIFLAMNKRFQRDTNGADPNFCVRCHAPMAVHDGKTKDGLNLADLPAAYRGVTCFFCHTASAVTDLHNNGLVYGDDPTMRGSFGNAMKTTAHETTVSKIHDQRVLESASMCGSCHDIQTPGGAQVERTFVDWQQSLFATEAGQTCGSCHMRAKTGARPITSVAGAPARTAHTHTFAGVDRALTALPNLDDQKSEIQDFLDASLQATLCITTLGQTAQFRVILDNVFAGHSFPSGATPDRRLWVELIAKKADDVVYQSGNVPDGIPVGSDAITDPDLWLLRDFLFDKNGKPTNQFGEATCYDSNVLPFPVTANVSDPRFYQRNVVREFPQDGSSVALPDTVTMRVRMIPIGLDVIDDLVASGDLDVSLRDKLEVAQVGPTVTWTPGSVAPYLDSSTGTVYECVTGTNQDFRAPKYPPTPISTCQR